MGAIIAVRRDVHRGIMIPGRRESLLSLTTVDVCTDVAGVGISAAGTVVGVVRALGLMYVSIVV